jgi:hypothetical protein
MPRQINQNVARCKELICVGNRWLAKQLSSVSHSAKLREVSHCLERVSVILSS